MRGLALKIPPLHHPSTGKEGRKTENRQERRRTGRNNVPKYVFPVFHPQRIHKFNDVLLHLLLWLLKFLLNIPHYTHTHTHIHPYSHTHTDFEHPMSCSVLTRRIVYPFHSLLLVLSSSCH